MVKRRRLLITLESRATFGYSVNVIRRAMADPALEVQTLVTGAHLMPELGNTESMLYQAQLPISASVPLSPGLGRTGWSVAMGHAISGFAEAYERLKPDIVMISGDRAETFALAVSAVYMGLPVAHIQAGDKSGHIDDAARMALAKLVHIHLAPGQDAVQRLRRLGEQEFRIFDTGAPQLDDMTSERRTSCSFSIRSCTSTIEWLVRSRPRCAPASPSEWRSCGSIPIPTLGFATFSR
jgi:GDP/UDP-N,N'-diacetylbacillosamine 2-epimerase (hydrolysing)